MPLAASSQSNITRQVLVPSVSFAKKSDKGGGGGSNNSGKDGDKGGNEDKDDKNAKKDKQNRNDKKDQEAKQAENGKKSKDRENEKQDKKSGDANKDKQNKDDSNAGKSQDTGKDTKDSDDRPARKNKQDKNGKKNGDDNKYKQEEYDEKDKDEGRDDAGDSDKQESAEDRHDHDSNERHDHDNGVAGDRHDHETEEGRHDHHEDDSHADSESAEHQEGDEHGDGGDPSTQDFASSDKNSEQSDDDVSEEPLEQQLLASEPAATLELSGIPPDSVTAGDPYLFRPAVEYDGQSTPVFAIAGLPLWASFDETTGELSGTPRETDVGVHESITISATDGNVEASLPPFSIAVGSATGSVTLSWTPPLENEDGSPLVDLAGYWIYWQNEADTDPESMKIDNPGLSTIVIDNLAAGTYEFAMTSFNLDGVESTRSNTITRIVEAGNGESASADAATDVTATAADEGEPDVAAATSESTPFLVIAGTPPEAVTADALYLFTPSVESSGESPPTFAIDGLPHWAGFNAVNGELYGAPAEEDIGFYDAITISATDGVVETSLPTFSIEVVAQGAAPGAVTLSWMPPTQNEDGSYLADLTGYWIYWGNNPGTYTEWMRIDNPGLTAIVIEDLVPGALEFAMTSFNADGVESSLSNAVTRFVE